MQDIKLRSHCGGLTVSSFTAPTGRMTNLSYYFKLCLFDCHNACPMFVKITIIAHNLYTLYKQTRGPYKVLAILVCTAVYGRVANITDLFYYINPNKMHMLQCLFCLTTALHISGVAITHLQEHKQL